MRAQSIGPGTNLVLRENPARSLFLMLGRHRVQTSPSELFATSSIVFFLPESDSYVNDV